MKRHEIKRQRREAEKSNKKYLMTLREIQTIKDESDRYRQKYVLVK